MYFLYVCLFANDQMVLGHKATGIRLDQGPKVLVNYRNCKFKIKIRPFLGPVNVNSRGDIKNIVLGWPKKRILAL